MKNLTQEAYLKLKQAIVDGELKPGERLVEQRVCQDFLIGRSPLREALRLLQMEGYVELIPNKGVSISKMTVEEVADIYDIVAVLEGYAAELATKQLNATDIRQLKSLNKKLKKAGTNKDYMNSIKENSRFHDLIVKASKNEQLYKIIRNLRDRIRRYRYMSVIAPNGNPEQYLIAHERILEALVGGEAARAGRLVRDHVIESKGTVISFLRSFPHL